MPRISNRLKKIIIIFSAIVMICAVAFLIGLYIFAESMEGIGDYLSFDGECIGQWSPDNPTAVEQSANLTLPPSATNLFADSTAFQDCFVFVSFDMAATDLETFLASTYVSELDRVTGSQLTPLISNLIQNDVDWSFDNEATYLYSRGSHESNLVSQTIVIANPDSDIYTVYVVTFLS
jgi:hypothetical protein